MAWENMSNKAEMEIPKMNQEEIKEVRTLQNEIKKQITEMRSPVRDLLVDWIHLRKESLSLRISQQIETSKPKSKINK